jgi:hypothetical protein
MHFLIFFEMIFSNLCLIFLHIFYRSLKNGSWSINRTRDKILKLSRRQWRMRPFPVIKKDISSWNWDDFDPISYIRATSTGIFGFTYWSVTRWHRIERFWHTWRGGHIHVWGKLFHKIIAFKLDLMVGCLKGHDTTSAAITWSILLIGSHPEVQVNSLI